MSSGRPRGTSPHACRHGRCWGGLRLSCVTAWRGLCRRAPGILRTALCAPFPFADSLCHHCDNLSCAYGCVWRPGSLPRESSNLGTPVPSPSASPVTRLCHGWRAGRPPQRLSGEEAGAAQGSTRPRTAPHGPAPRWAAVTRSGCVLRGQRHSGAGTRLQACARARHGGRRGVSEHTPPGG